MDRDANYDRLWRYVFSVFGHIDDFKQKVEPEDRQFCSLTVSQTRVLRVVRGMLDEVPHGITLKELAARLRISPASASEMVDVLVRKGLLCRNQSSEDRRAIAINFSPLLIARGPRVENIFSSGIAELCNELSDEELETLSNLMEKLHGKAIAPRPE